MKKVLKTKFSVDDILSFEPCSEYNREKIEKLFKNKLNIETK
jgi:hypothetical protein